MSLKGSSAIIINKRVMDTAETIPIKQPKKADVDNVEIDS
jgi:hypothetical protein